MKKVLILILILAVAFAIFGCQSAEAFGGGNGNGSMCGVNIYVDKSTGVNYLVAKNYDNGIAICPRYNADGTLYVSEVE